VGEYAPRVDVALEAVAHEKEMVAARRPSSSVMQSFRKNFRRLMANDINFRIEEDEDGSCVRGWSIAVGYISGV